MLEMVLIAGGLYLLDVVEFPSVLVRCSFLPCIVNEFEVMHCDVASRESRDGKSMPKSQEQPKIRGDDSPPAHDSGSALPQRDSHVPRASPLSFLQSRNNSPCSSSRKFALVGPDGFFTKGANNHKATLKKAIRLG